MQPELISFVLNHWPHDSVMQVQYVIRVNFSRESSIHLWKSEGGITEPRTSIEQFKRPSNLVLAKGIYDYGLWLKVVDLCTRAYDKENVYLCGYAGKGIDRSKNISASILGCFGFIFDFSYLVSVLKSRRPWFNS